MPSPNDNSELLEEWKRLENELISIGFSRRKSHLNIAEKYNVDLTTVYRWMTPDFKEKHRLYCKRYRAKRLTNEMNRKYRIKYLNKPEGRKKFNEYQRKYLKLIRNLGTYVVNLCREKNEPISLEEITGTINKNFEIDMRQETIVTAIKKYNKSRKKPKLLEVRKSFYIFPKIEISDFDLI